jgi:phenylacetic acid degradation operon negative regulatory protein
MATAVERAESAVEERAAGSAAVRPQALMFTFLGEYLLPGGVCVSAQSIIDVFARVDFSEHATRTMLTRMVRRGFLRRQRAGRKMYFGLTPWSTAILEDGRRRIWKTGAVNTETNGAWTLIAFSLPESWQQQRHDLRSRLIWAGFGSLQGGLWIAPSRVDTVELLRDLGLDSRVKAFTAEPAPPTDLAEMIKDAYDLNELAATYRAFIAAWCGRHPLPEAPDDLARHLLLVTEWLQIIRRDPRLPVAHLAADWPAHRAEELFLRLHARLEPQATSIANDLLDTAPDEEWQDTPHSAVGPAWRRPGSPPSEVAAGADVTV